MDLQQLAKAAEAVLREDGAMVRSLPHPKVYTKEGHANFVTEADLASQKFLFQLLMDIGGFLVFGGLFWRKVKSKPLYLLSVLLFAVIFYITACQ